MKCCAASVGFSLLSALLVAPTTTAEGSAPDVLKLVQETVAPVHVAVQAFVSSHLRAAVWGKYDARVTVEGAYTIDLRPRVFEAHAGSVAVTIPDKQVSTGISRSGLVLLPSREEAFHMGVPFFIDGVRFAAPDKLSFVLSSNPDVTTPVAHWRLQRVSVGEGGVASSVEVVGTTVRLSSLAEPRTVTLTQDELAGWVLSIVTQEPYGRRLVSNEVMLDSLADRPVEASAPKP